jgi:hypothetical protein
MRASECLSSTRVRSTRISSPSGPRKLDVGIQAAPAANDPPSVLTGQIGVSDIDLAIERCRSAGIRFELEHNEPAPGWAYHA